MKILMVCTNPDYVEKDTGTTASRNKLISLLSQNNEVVFLNAQPAQSNSRRVASIADNHRVYYFKQWSMFGRWLPMFTDFNLSFVFKIRRIVKNEGIDLICITEPFGIVATSIVCRSIPVLYDAHDVVSEFAELVFQRIRLDFKLARIPILSTIARILFLNYMYYCERLACSRVKHVIAITELDRQRFMQRYNISESKVTAIPIWMTPNASRDTRTQDREHTGRNRVKVIFHGTFRHPPNYEAFRLIENYIAPEVWKRDKTIEFVLAGTDSPQYERDNIRALGYVEDLRTILDDSDIAIVPFLQGTGVRMKILDYLAYGLPVITTRKGIEGINTKNGEQAISVETVNGEFIDAILALASDKEKRRRIGINARKLIESEYSREAIYPKLERVLQTVLGPAQG